MSKHLGEFEQLLMFALVELEGDAHGVTIRRAIEDRTGRQVSPGAVYTALERLESRGFVSSRAGDTTPERRVARLSTILRGWRTTRLAFGIAAPPQVGGHAQARSESGPGRPGSLRVSPL